MEMVNWRYLQEYSTVNIEFEQDLSVGLGTTLVDRYKILKKLF